MKNGKAPSNPFLVIPKPVFKQPHCHPPVPEPCLCLPPSALSPAVFLLSANPGAAAPRGSRNWEGQERWGQGGCFMSNIPGAQTHSKWPLEAESSWT